MSVTEHEIEIWDQERMFRLQGNLLSYKLPHTLKYERVDDGRNGTDDKWTFTFDGNTLIERMIGEK